jgi:Transcriptional Coactivator p15 (PC4)
VRANSAPLGDKENIRGRPHQQAFPIIIAERDRNSREVVRVALNHWNSRDTIDVRTWYRDDGEVKPSKSGITLAVKHLSALAAAMAKALARAIELGLVEEGDEQ